MSPRSLELCQQATAAIKIPIVPTTCRHTRNQTFVFVPLSIYTTKYSTHKPFLFTAQAGFLARRPKNKKYTNMIMGLADAVGASPFNLVAAASYLRDWVSERLTLQPPIDVSVLASPRLRGAVGSMDGAVAGAVVALEPNVSDVRVERASVSLPPQVVVDPRMEVICGMAKALHAEGSEWLHAFRKAHELWDKLNPNVRNALNVSEGSVQHEDVVGRDPLPLVEDQLEDDAAVPLEAELDR